MFEKQHYTLNKYIYLNCDGLSSLFKYIDVTKVWTMFLLDQVFKVTFWRTFPAVRFPADRIVHLLGRPGWWTRSSVVDRTGPRRAAVDRGHKPVPGWKVKDKQGQKHKCSNIYCEQSTYTKLVVARECRSTERFRRN